MPRTYKAVGPSRNKAANPVTETKAAPPKPPKEDKKEDKKDVDGD
jgi:hypothetical protein